MRPLHRFVNVPDQRKINQMKRPWGDRSLKSRGIFGADKKISLINNGPVTISPTNL